MHTFGDVLEVLYTGLPLAFGAIRVLAARIRYPYIPKPLSSLVALMTHGVMSYNTSCRNYLIAGCRADEHGIFFLSRHNVLGYMFIQLSHSC